MSVGPARFSAQDENTDDNTDAGWLLTVAYFGPTHVRHTDANWLAARARGGEIAPGANQKPLRRRVLTHQAGAAEDEASAGLRALGSRGSGGSRWVIFRLVSRSTASGKTRCLRDTADGVSIPSIEMLLLHADRLGWPIASGAFEVVLMEAGKRHGVPWKKMS